MHPIQSEEEELKIEGDDDDRFPRHVSDVELLEPLSPEEAARYLRMTEPKDETSMAQPDPRADEWRALRARYQSGDQFWHYTNSAECWAGLAGEAGIALVRGEEIMGNIVTMVS